MQLTCYVGRETIMRSIKMAYYGQQHPIIVFFRTITAQKRTFKHQLYLIKCLWFLGNMHIAIVPILPTSNNNEESFSRHLKSSKVSITLLTIARQIFFSLASRVGLSSFARFTLEKNSPGILVLVYVAWWRSRRNSSSKIDRLIMTFCFLSETCYVGIANCCGVIGVLPLVYNGPNSLAKGHNNQTSRSFLPAYNLGRVIPFEAVLTMSFRLTYMYVQVAETRI